MILENSYVGRLSIFLTIVSICGINYAIFDESASIEGLVFAIGANCLSRLCIQLRNCTDFLCTFWRLARVDYTNCKSLKNWLKGAKFVGRSIATFPWTLAWLREIQNDPKMRGFLLLNPSITSKLHRPYLYRSLRLSGKLKVLKDHYRIVSTKLPAHINSLLLTNENVHLAKIISKYDNQFDVILTKNHFYEKEGELSLQIRNLDGASICTLTFSLHFVGGKIAITIGGLQGPPKPFGIDDIRNATKEFFGLFPKRLLVEVLMMFAKFIEIDCIYAVGNDEHVYSSWRYRQPFFANYDEFWSEMKSVKDVGGLHVLPLRHTRRSAGEIKCSKRSLYRQRFEFLDSVESDIRLYFSELNCSR